MIRLADFSLTRRNTPLLSNINLEFQSPGCHALIGPSNCGKSLILHVLNRLVDKEQEYYMQGDILYEGKSIYQIPLDTLRQEIGLVSKDATLFETMSIYDNVIIGFKLQGIKKSKIEFDGIVEQALRTVKLWEAVSERLYKRGGFLTRGEVLRLCLARFIALGSRCILIDEPTRSLDLTTRQVIHGIFSSLKLKHLLIVASHDVDFVSTVADHCSLLRRGKLVESSPTELLLADPEEEFTRTYLSQWMIRD
jgi:phosphate transport system ATP-binding protein